MTIKNFSKSSSLSLLIVFLLTTIFTAFSPLLKTEALTLDTDKEYIIYSKLCTWKCLQPTDLSSENGTQINLWDYWGQSAQRWKFSDAGDGYYYIINAESNKVMDIQDYSVDNGANAILWDNKYSYNQQFKLIAAEDGYFKIQNRNSNLVLDLLNYESENGTNIIQYEDKNTDNQMWCIEPVTSSSNSSSMRNSQEIVNDMGVGWNLGNSLDCIASWIDNGTPSQYETAWGNPVTTKAMIDTIKAAGFNTVRIPVSWGEHMGASPDYTVNSDWMNRVEEVVNYVLDNDMYAIINVHHDGEWCIPTYANEVSASDKLQKLWIQIANKFKNYDDHLIFEALNEPRLEGTEYEWTGGTPESRDMVNRLNKVALNAIRSTGGNNINRSVMIPTYAASGMSLTINALEIPDDDNIIVSLHAYTPYTFAMDVSGTDYWGSYSDIQALNDEFDSYYNTFVAKGIPVVIGEFGSINKNNTTSRSNLAYSIVSAAKKRGMSCIWWDNNSTTVWQGETFGLLNRSTLTWEFPEIVGALINGYNDTIE